jgi:CheY-like chemotaxis protein
VLVVDDEDHIREVTQLSLEAVGGWNVVAAASAEEALHLAEEHSPDAILLDVMMPDMDGPTTFKHLQANPATRDIPVVLLTAKAQGQDSRLFADLGVAGVIAKPFDPMTLADQVRTLLQW